MSLKAFIVNLDGKVFNPICYLFESHSTNTADNIFSNIQNIYHLTNGRLLGIPFVLSVKMVETMNTGQKVKYPIWEIQTVNTIEQITDLADRGVIPTTVENRVEIEGVTSQNQLTEPVTAQNDENDQNPTQDIPKEDRPIESDPGSQIKDDVEKAKGEVVKKIGDIVMRITKQNKDEAMKLLEEVTAYKDAPGKKHMADLYNPNFKAARASVVYGKLKKMYKETFNEEYSYQNELEL